MQIIITIPAIIISFCRENKVPDYKIPKLFKEYLNQNTLNESWGSCKDEFSNWFEENGEDTLQDIQ